MPLAAVAAAGLTGPPPWKASVTVAPDTGVPLSWSVTVPVMEALAGLAGGLWKSAPGAASFPPRLPA